jgi:hypothetical protein
MRDFEQAALLGVHRGLEELLRVHFTETLVALDAEALAAVGADLGDDVEGAEELDAVLALLAGVFGDGVAGLLGGAEASRCRGRLARALRSLAISVLS